MANLADLMRKDPDFQQKFVDNLKIIMPAFREQWWGYFANFSAAAMFKLHDNMRDRMKIYISWSDVVVFRQYLVRHMADHIAEEFDLEKIPQERIEDPGVRGNEKSAARRWWDYDWVWSNLDVSTRNQISEAVDAGAIGPLTIQEGLNQLAKYVAISKHPPGRKPQGGGSVLWIYENTILPGVVQIFEKAFRTSVYNQDLRTILHNSLKRDMIHIIWQKALLYVNPWTQRKMFTNERREEDMKIPLPVPLFAPKGGDKGGGQKKQQQKKKGGGK